MADEHRNEAPAPGLNGPQARGEASGRTASLLVEVAHEGLRVEECDRAARAIERLLLGAPEDPTVERTLARNALCAGLDRIGAELLARSLRTSSTAPTREEVATLAGALARASHDVPPAVLCEWAEVVCTVQGGEAAARLLIKAAERSCEARRWRDALDLCAKAAAFDPGARDLHSLWSLGLLNLGDLLGAHAHLTWSRELAPSDALTWIGEAEVLSLQGRSKDAAAAAHTAARLLGVELDGSKGPVPLGEILERIGSRAPIVAASCLAPVWAFPPEAGGRAPENGQRPRVLLTEDTHFHRLLLSKILTDAGMKVLIPMEDEPATEALRRASPAPELVLAPIVASDPDHVGLLRELRKSAPENIDVLGITTLDRSGLDFEALRQLGVVGLIDKSSLPEQLIFRINQIVRPGGGRRQERVPAFIPIDLVAGGHTSAEYAVNLSMGGMGVTSTRPLEPNDDVTVRLRLPLHGGELFELPGRVIYRRPGAAAGAPHELGIFFYPLSPEVESKIAVEIHRIARA